MDLHAVKEICRELPGDDASWFALLVKPRHEKCVDAILRNKGYESFFPYYRCARRHCGRARMVELPLFPGYLFCRFDPLQRLPILVTPGVLQVIGCGRVPAPVAEQEVEALKNIVHSRLEAGPWPYLKTGCTVQIEDGPLRGVEGILLGCESNAMLVVSVTLLQRSVAVKIERDWVSPVPYSITQTPARRDAPRLTV